MEELRWEDVGRISRTDYIDREKVEKIRKEGFELITIYGDIERKIKFGNPIYGVFRAVGTASKPEPVKAPEPKKLATETNDSGIEKEYPEAPKGKRMSFADKVRAEKAGK